MRYMGRIGRIGDANNPFPPLPNVLPNVIQPLPPLDPSAKALMLAQASTMSDANAKDLLDIADATPYGSQQRYIRMGIGAAVGLVVGVIAGRAMKKR